jgi:16S rRNA (guanine(527)-N(7))-methyltransferase RsmG
VGRIGGSPQPPSVSRETPLADQQPLRANDFRAITGASVAEVERLAAYLDLLRRWQARINLVGGGTLADPWRRHFLDSAQLARLLPAGNPKLIDLGSGAGFPGLVLAILTRAQVRLVESDQRKCAFLLEAARVTGVSVRIDNARIESLEPNACDTVTARALAPLPELLAYSCKLLAPRGSCLFLKGRNWRAELTQAEQSWNMRVTPIQSRSDSTGVILKIDELSERHER